MERGVKVGICLSLFLILSISFVSANAFTDFFKNIFGGVQLSPEDGLVGYYKFDGNIQDSSGKSHGGTCTISAAGNKCPTYVTAKDGTTSAASFDGFDDFVYVKTNTDFNFGSEDYSIALWMKFPISGNSSWEGIVSKGYSTSAATVGSYGLVRDGTKTNSIRFQDVASVGSFNVNVASGSLTDSWHHIAIVRSGGDGFAGAVTKLYVDGVEKSSSVLGAASLDNSADFRIGQANARFFKGIIDDLRIYNKALSQDEINSLAGISSNTCTDSDSGLNYNVKGLVQISDSLGNIIGYEEDGCVDSIVLEEGFCLSNGQGNTVGYNCPNGCLDGACIGGNVTTCTSDEDCPSQTTKYCDKYGDACVSSMQYSCVGGECISFGGGASCKHCNSGCENGICLSGNENEDLVKLEKTSNKFNLGESWWDISILPFVDSNMPNFLKDKEFKDNQGNLFKYAQKVLVGDLFLSEFSDNDYHDGELTTGIRILGGEFVLNYTLEFIDQPKWDDLDGSEIYLLGEDYLIQGDIAGQSLDLIGRASGKHVILSNDKDVNISGRIVTGMKSYLKSSGDSLSKIILEWQADDDLFITEENNVVMPGFETLRFVFKGMTTAGGETYGNLYLGGKYSSGSSTQVCSNFINEIKNPKSFTENEVTYTLSYNSSYKGYNWINGQQEVYHSYYSAWDVWDGQNSGYLSYSIRVFDNPNVDLKEIEESSLDNPECKLSSRYIEGEGNSVIVCNWNALSPSPINPYPYKYRTVLWYSGNVQVEAYISEYNYLSDEEVAKAVQENINDFIISLRGSYTSTYVGWENFDLFYPQAGQIDTRLSSCPSKLSQEICSPSWNCLLTPTICPEYGSQQIRCQDYTCDKSANIMLSCTPGICSGCIIPAWIYPEGESLDTKCIPYGIRFEHTIGFSEGSSSEKETDSLSVAQAESEQGLSLSITSDGVASLLVEGWDNQTYTFKKGDTVEVDASVWGDGVTKVSFYADDVVYNSDNYEESYIIITFTITREGNVVENKVNSYCDYDGQVKMQKTVNSKGGWANCQNSYECESNICSSGECIEVTQMIQEASAFKRAVVKLWCKVINPISDTEYANCVYNLIGENVGTGGSGGGSGGSSA